MLLYIIKRLLSSALLLLIASFIVFLGVRVTVDPLARYATVKDKQVLERVSQRLGLHDPLIKQYGRWASHAIRGDLGVGDHDQEPVTEKIKRGLSHTIELILWGALFAGCVGISFGIVAALKRNSPTDYALSGFSYFGIAIPTFAFAYFLMDIFSIRLPQYFSQHTILTAPLKVWGFMISLFFGIVYILGRKRIRNLGEDSSVRLFAYTCIGLGVIVMTQLISQLLSSTSNIFHEIASNSISEKLWWSLIVLLTCTLLYGVIGQNEISRDRHHNKQRILTFSIVLGPIIVFFMSLLLITLVSKTIPHIVGEHQPWLYTTGSVEGSFGRSSSGYWSLESIREYTRHLLMPTLVLSIQLIASWSRYQRASMVEALQSDYIRTAYSKGMSKSRVYLRHALRNSEIPIVTVIALDIGLLFQGLIITESIFSIPGMSSIFIKALDQGDATTIAGWTLVTAFFVIASNLIADLILPVVDPRIRTQ